MKSTNDPQTGFGVLRRFAAALVALGLLYFTLVGLGLRLPRGWLGFFLCFGSLGFGSVLWTGTLYRQTSPGIKNHGNFHRPLQKRGLVSYLLFAVLGAFYLFYYWWPGYLRQATALLDPLSQLLRGVPADHWFMYSYLYSVAVLLMAVRFHYRFRHSRYQLIRNISVTFFQLVLAFLVPAILRSWGQPEFYFSYFWPLLPDYFYPSGVAQLIQHPGGWGRVMVVWTITFAFIGVPVLTYFFGKRWYCSWVCGCGGLAETAGDPFRHLSRKNLASWRFERWSIHLVLLLIVLGTALLWIDQLSHNQVLGQASAWFVKFYKFLIMSVLAGAVGVAFYPLLGSRVWCRFFCPQAAILGIFQRFFSRFRITTNGSQCMSCGNCSTYCEMGIDVRSYAQQGANIVRASCVGCGLCSAVCPRGVLNLECGRTHKDRFRDADKPLRDLLGALRKP